MTALITSGQTRAALASVRSLGRANLAVAVSAPASPALSFWSRYATSTLLLPRADTHPQLHRKALLEEILGRRVTMVLPTQSRDVIALSEIRHALPEEATAVLPTKDELSRVLRRDSLFDLVESLRIPCVPRLLIDDAKTLEPRLREAQKLPFPVAVRRMPRGQGDEANDDSVIILHDIGSLRRLLYADPDLVDDGVTVESRPPEAVIRCGVIAQRGEVVASVFEHVMRSRTYTLQSAVVVETMEEVPAIRKAVEKITTALRWSGPAQLSFIVVDGKIQFVDFLPRLWDTVSLATHAGVDIPLGCYHLSAGHPWVGRRTAEPGLRQRWFLGDVRRAVEHATGHEHAREAGLWRRATAVLSLLNPADLLKSHSDIFAKDDPMPFILEARRLQSS